ncbi:hypothetical protein BBO99_00005919 [Phytophthora kernoviae]|uniref:Uncharacterized protein n=1 Tax=Phytophthora kernoviae TaxID=325452 RepID=A0A421GMA7_9STRA|nr:hypothetical protein BBO99_00005919 [Phytophthora kernoviae]
MGMPGAEIVTRVETVVTLVEILVEILVETLVEILVVTLVETLVLIGVAISAQDGPGPSPYGDPNARRGGMPDAPYYQESPQQQLPYRQQQQQQPPRENYNSYSYNEYGALPGEYQQRAGGRPMGPGGYGPGQQQPQQQRYPADHLLPSPAPAANKGYGGRNRRGGGGGRYNRR